MTNLTLAGYDLLFVEADGSTKRLTHRTHEAAEAAKKAIELGEFDAQKLTFREFVELRWKPYHADHRLLHNTRSSYMSALETELLPYFGDMKLADITPATVTYFIEDWALSRPSIKGLGPMVTKLSAILGIAHRWGYIPYNPVSRVAYFFIGSRPLEIEYEGWKRKSA